MQKSASRLATLPLADRMGIIDSDQPLAGILALHEIRQERALTSVEP
jgi:hypothetical protein